MSFSDITGQTLYQAPGSINGESCVLKNLVECSVFILDYTSEVEVSNCSNCQIFIGPVDGPAIFDGCTNCQVAVACQQFQAKNCERIAFGLYCATQPSLSNCSGITIACWAGAYPGLSAHFMAANLDPKANHWNKVYDASAVEDAAPNFTLLEGAAPEYWEVPLDGQGPCENPVPGADGSLYAPVPEAAEPEAPAAPEPEPLPENGFAEEFVLPSPQQPPHVDSSAVPTTPSGMLEPAATGEHPRVAAARQKLQARLAEQAKFETEQMAEIEASAARYLEQFYERRNKSRDERIKDMREKLEGKGNGERAPEGSTQWERTASIIDFNFTRPNGSDLSRFKAVLLACKAKGTIPTAA